MFIVASIKNLTIINSVDFKRITERGKIVRAYFHLFRMNT